MKKIKVNKLFGIWKNDEQTKNVSSCVREFRKPRKIEVVHSCGNVFADMGLPDAKEMLVKCQFFFETTIPAEVINPELVTNPIGVYLKGLRNRENLTQIQLAKITGIPCRHIREMESGKKPIDKINARKLAEALKAEYRFFL